MVAGLQLFFALGAPDAVIDFHRADAIGESGQDAARADHVRGAFVQRPAAALFAPFLHDRVAKRGQPDGERRKDGDLYEAVIDAEQRQ